MHNQIDLNWCDRHPRAVRAFMTVSLGLLALMASRIVADALKPFAEARVDLAGALGVDLGVAKMACPQFAFMGYEARLVYDAGREVSGMACWDFRRGKLIVRSDDWTGAKP